MPPENSIVSLTCLLLQRGWRGDGLADQVLLKIVCLLMSWLFSLSVLMIRSDRAKRAELLVLCHEDEVLGRNTGRIRYEPGDRACGVPESGHSR